MTFHNIQVHIGCAEAVVVVVVALSATGWQQSSATENVIVGKWLELHFGRYPSADFACSILISFFLQLDLDVYIKILSSTMCVSKGNTEKPTRDFLNHCHKAEEEIEDYANCLFCTGAEG